MLQEIIKWLPLVNVIVIPAIGWALRQFLKDFPSKKEVEVIAEKTGELERRLFLIERDMTSLPNSAQFEDLRRDVLASGSVTRELSAQIAGLRDVMKHMQTVLEQLLENELAEGRRAKTP